MYSRFRVVEKTGVACLVNIVNVYLFRFTDLINVATYKNENEMVVAGLN